MIRRHGVRRWAAALAAAAVMAGCAPEKGGALRPRLALFVGVDISGSFVNGDHFNDALAFLSRYLYVHLNGFGGLDVPDALFVGSIGGDKPGEPKTFFPKQTFQGKSVEEIERQLRELFPKKQTNPLTDFNAFFSQVADTVRNKNLVLRPISVVMISDGKPALDNKKPNYGAISLAPLENLSRNVTVRLLYTDAETGRGWQDRVPRRRVKVWTQDAAVMTYWKDPSTWDAGRPPSQQDKFFLWLKDNVDFATRGRRVTG
jgi:hypothetical protein